ncbi:uncharacterized protein E0L32_003732 [Thyridium curvatum]|uniref:Arginine N-methyltransferase 2 n=1 Tax=Thyridium curvatum TaxID=1093900 RepID=A0A507BIE8_9PEZI|nr:uncharacterized protein E0L32_003732 [Thyridium curvatum]TPX16438.1 hypothetical protein E0L32_003732 [Thyridium curvatum]
MASSDPASDSLESRISASCPADTRRILEAAWHHDTAALKTLLDVPGKASCQDPKTGETPLHAAIRACGHAAPEPESGSIDNTAAAKDTVYKLFLYGAIWNDVDDRNETPGCLAHRLGQRELYSLCVDAGVRAEMLFGLMEGYEELSSGSDEEDEDMDGDDAGEAGEEEHHANGADDGDEAPELVNVEEDTGATADAVVEEEPERFVPPKTAADDEVKSETYLRSKLTYSEGKLVDDEGNGVMMAWETDIMQRSVDALLGPDKQPGKRVLNVGFGMGIVDTMFRATAPARHHIIEAHPEVLARIARPESTFAAADWEGSGPGEGEGEGEGGAYKVHAGRWQEVVPGLLERGEVYDAIYFDTFGEDYSQLRLFFTEFVPALLDERGTFSFFNGLGADRQICYDVYTKVVEMHLADAGLDVDWKEVGVDMQQLHEAGKGEWEGVKRRYWTLDSKSHCIVAVITSHHWDAPCY